MAKQLTSFTCSRHGTFPNRKACPECAKEKSIHVEDGNYQVTIHIVEEARKRVIAKLESARAREHARVLKMAAAILRYHNEDRVATKVEDLAEDLQEGSK